MALPPNDPFMLALAAYQAQNLKEAATFCATALEEKPDNAACLHLMGVLKMCLGESAEAEGLLRRSVALKPGFPEAHYTFAQVLNVCGQYEEAIEHYEKTLALKPHHAGAFFGLGNAWVGRGDKGKAAAAYEQAIALNPDHPEALNNLGVFRFEQNDYAEALRLHKRAIELRPAYAEAHNNLGNIYKEQKKWAKAIESYRRAMTLNPDLLQAINNMGLALLYGASDLEAAVACFRQILDKHPLHPAANTHLGITLCMQGDFAQGVAVYDKALEAAPRYKDALNNKGNALKALGRLEEALASYRQVEAMDPEDPEIQNNLAMILLTMGRFEEGWRKYEARWHTVQLGGGRRDFSQPQWQGEEGQGRTLLLHAEQGFGDTLQFCRYAPLAAQRGWRVIVEAQLELAVLLRSLEGIAAVMPRGAPLPAFDRHCPLLSLPLVFGTRVETIPAETPYIAADPSKIAAWRERLATDKARLKVGLTWEGNPRLFSIDLAAANARRSLPPEALAALNGIDGVQFYSLQKKKTSGSAPRLAMIDWMDECRDFSDTAALIANLDLVLSVDTAVAHLAGALGKPIWLLNRFDTCWRWFRDREDSPWYPTMRLFRQPRSGDWASVMQEIRRTLAL